MQNDTSNKQHSIWKPVLITVLAACLFGGALAVPFLLSTHAGSGQSAMDKFNAVYNVLKKDWYYGKDSDDLDNRLIDQAIAGMTTLDEDAHTGYMNNELAQKFSDSLAGTNVGIGVSFYMGKNGQMVVKKVYTNSTADKAGLQPGDEIVRVGDKKPGAIDLEQLLSYIKSFEGKPLELEVSRNGQPLTMTVTPGVFDTTVSTELGDNYGLITLSSFSSESGKEFTEGIGRVQKSGAKNLILDLRNNSGGYVSAARTIASSLLPDDSVVFVENLKDGTQKKIMTDNSYGQVNFDHIYILQNDKTASASEVLIGALKDNLGDKVVTIGTNSYGKGTEQVTRQFEDGTSMKYTVAEWTTPNGTSINKTGFTPDEPVELEEVQTVVYHPMDENSQPIAPDTVGDNAAAVQVFLRYLGYPANRSDAYFSVASSEALKQFQQDNGLDPTGIIDTQDRKSVV